MTIWYTAPIVVLDRWSELYEVIEGLMEDPVKLDGMQRDLLVWYEIICAALRGRRCGQV